MKKFNVEVFVVSGKEMLNLALFYLREPQEAYDCMRAVVQTYSGNNPDEVPTFGEKETDCMFEFFFRDRNGDTIRVVCQEDTE